MFVSIKHTDDTHTVWAFENLKGVFPVLATAGLRCTVIDPDLIPHRIAQLLIDHSGGWNDCDELINCLQERGELP